MAVSKNIDKTADSYAGGFELVVDTLTQERIAGTLRSEDAAGLKFEVTRKKDNRDIAGRISITDIRGGGLVEIVSVDGMAELSILDGGYRKRYEQEPEAPVPAPYSSAAGDVAYEDYVEYGDPELIQGLLRSKSYALIPLLSRSLGAAGVTGHTFPISAGFHLLALGVNQHLTNNGLSAGSLPSGKVTYLPDLAPDADVVFGFDGGDVSVVYKDNSREGTRQYWKSIYGLMGLTDLEAELAVSFCDNLLNAGLDVEYAQCITPKPDGECIEPDPANDCLGMCGPHCDQPCWDWICGDCCVHPGCEFHDAACNESLLLCFTPAVFLQGLRC